MFVVDYLTLGVFGVCGSLKVRIFLKQRFQKESPIFLNEDASLLSFLDILVSVLLNSPLLLILMNMYACYNGTRIF